MGTCQFGETVNRDAGGLDGEKPRRRTLFVKTFDDVAAVAALLIASGGKEFAVGDDQDVLPVPPAVQCVQREREQARRRRAPADVADGFAVKQLPEKVKPSHRSHPLSSAVPLFPFARAAPKCGCSPIQLCHRRQPDASLELKDF